jgi:thioredoxin-dependent peroxiredoxin
MASPSVGDVAPDFTLPGTGGRSYTLSAYRGQPVVLVFYPADNTPVCTNQLSTYSSDIERFSGLGAQVLALSPQGIESHERFAESLGLTFPLLADEEKEVGKLYGIVGPLGFYRRSVFVIDSDGVVRYTHRAVSGLTYRPTDELVEAIEAVART